MRKNVIFLFVAATIIQTLRAVDIETSQGTLQLIPIDDNAIRVRMIMSDARQPEELIYVGDIAEPAYEITETENNVTVTANGIAAVFDRENETLEFYDRNGNNILSEMAQGRVIVPSEIQDEKTYASSQKFMTQSDEYLCGTGQFQDGYLNIKGLTRRLTQVNTQISLPFVLSNKGYGILWNNYGLTDFNPAGNNVLLSPSGQGESVTVDATSTTGNRKEVRNMGLFTGTIDIPETGDYSIMLDVGQRMARKHKITIDGATVADFNNIWLPPTTSMILPMEKGLHEVEVEGVDGDSPSIFWRKDDNTTTFSSPVSPGIDYTVFAGNGDEVIASYRRLTGAASLLPEWGYGYIHCRERYNTQHELLENASEFRKRGIPIDVIVQDWQYWGKHGWNAMRFDEERYPDPAGMVSKLHNDNIRLMISVWAKIDANSELGRQAKEKGYFIPGSEWVDFFNPEAADFYWHNSSSRMIRPYGIDALWQDATEPENDDLQGRKIAGAKIPGEIYRNCYPLVINRVVYGGLRNDVPEKRPLILTRSAFPGMQRYATVTWSGDVGNDWETLRRQIAGGLGQMAAGHPWWTFDAGGFFRPGDQYTNTEYHELFIRWLQTSAFLPLMRVHGYMSNAEPWRYGEKVDSVSKQYINLRYKLLPYIYSNAARVWREGYTLMRPLVMDFPDDDEALTRDAQYMFGDAFLVSPVLAPGVSTWKTYLPKGAGWTDYWTGARYDGGSYAETEAGIDRIPVFVRNGSIIPANTRKIQYAGQFPDQPIELTVYPGADGRFTLYEDEGDNNNHEKGMFSVIDMSWDDAHKTLTIDDRKGSFDGMDNEKTFVVKVGGHSKTVNYKGNKISVLFD